MSTSDTPTQTTIDNRCDRMIDDTEVYYLPLTGEIFEDYEEYVNRAIQYKQQKNKFRASGSQNTLVNNTSFVQQEIRDTKMNMQYPKHILEHICARVHNNTNPIKNIVDTIYDYFKDNLILGEELLCEIDNNSVYTVKILRIVKKPKKKKKKKPTLSAQQKASISFITNSTEVDTFTPPSLAALVSPTEPKSNVITISSDEEDDDDEDNTLYEVEVVNGSRQFEKFIVFRHSLIRKECPVTKVGMYKWIKDNTTREPYFGAPLILKPEVLEFFGLKNVEDANAYFSEKRKQMDIDTDYEELYEQTQTNKNLTENGMTFTFRTSDFELIDPFSVDNSVQYPIYDQHVKRDLNDPHHDNYRPIPKTDYPIPKECVSDALMIWDFLYTFRHAFQVSPFPLDDFLVALSYRRENTLLNEALQVFLLLLLNNRDIRNETKIQKICKGIRSQFASKKKKKGLNSIKQIIRAKCTAVLLEFLSAQGFFDEKDPDEETTEENEEEKNQDSKMKSEEPTEPPNETTNEENKQTTDQQETKKPEQQEEAKKEETQKSEDKEKKQTDEQQETKDSDDQDTKEEEDSEEDTRKKSPIFQEWEKVGFYGLSPEIKLKVFMFLMEKVYTLQKVRAAIEQINEEKKQLIKQKYSEQTEALQKQREELEKLRKKRESIMQAMQQNESEQDLVALNQNREKYREIQERERLFLQESRDQKEKREENFELELSELLVRTRPLGMDRHYNRYWYFPGFSGRLFVEKPYEINKTLGSKRTMPPPTEWGYYDTPEELEKLLNYLDPRGIRESDLIDEIEREKDNILEEMKERALKLKEIEKQLREHDEKLKALANQPQQPKEKKEKKQKTKGSKKKESGKDEDAMDEDTNDEENKKKSSKKQKKETDNKQQKKRPVRKSKRASKDESQDSEDEEEEESTVQKKKPTRLPRTRKRKRVTKRTTEESDKEDNEAKSNHVRKRVQTRRKKAEKHKLSDNDSEENEEPKKKRVARTTRNSRRRSLKTEEEESETKQEEENVPRVRRSQRLLDKKTKKVTNKRSKREEEEEEDSSEELSTSSSSESSDEEETVNTISFVNYVNEYNTS